jgi:SSS family transporter
LVHLSALALLLVPTRLSGIDLAIVALYLIGITIFGLRFRKRGSGKAADKSLKTYFLADNTVPWWAIALSVVSAETSTLTIVSIPGLAFGGDFGFLQIALGYMVGRVVVALLFLPRYFAGEMLTAYQLIDRRFGPVLHKVTAGLFLLTRAAAEGVRVFAVSIVVGIAIGTNDIVSIAIISALTLLYTFEGGLAAVIWTDVVQMAIYIIGTGIALLTLGSHVGGGWHEIHTVATAAGKFHWLNFAVNLTESYTFLAGLLGGAFLTMASHGTDQLMVQRLLAARNLRQSQVALLSSGLVIFLQFWMFLLIGAGLYVFAGQHPGTFAGLTSDRLFPAFIVREMPVGIAGLLIAAILAAAMSNLSAALNSLSSTTVVDFYIRLRPAADDRERSLVAKSSTVLWALVLFAIAVYSVRVGGKGHVVEIGLSIASVAYGCLLGVFLLGTLTRFANQIGTSIGMIVGFALNLWLWQGTFPMHIGSLVIPHIAFTWYVLIGAAVTFVVGALASLPFKRSRSAVAAAVMIAVACCISARAQQTAPDFSQVSSLINTAIGEQKLPGAVLIVGHNGKVVFEHAYGVRKYADEPSLDGKPSPAEPMTEDTIFDMASLTKCLATATAIMQLDEAGKLSIDDPVEKYLPAFNATHDPVRATVTLRMLLMHISGEPADVNLKDPWGLTAPDRAEGLHRALTTSLQSAPEATFRYSDINFILLGGIVEAVSGQREDVYVAEHIYKPLGMTHTAYHPFDKACGPALTSGTAIEFNGTAVDQICALNTWIPGITLRNTAPTQHDNEGTAATNPNFDHLLRGTVHDPTTRRMGGVAGHAGLFSTAADVSRFAQALLDRLAGRPSDFPLSQRELQRMTAPEAAGREPDTIFTQDLTGPIPTLRTEKGQDVHGLGWDINTAFSRPRGAFFFTAAPSVPSSPQPSFGHTGFTGTTLWMDPTTDTYTVLLSNSVHPRGKANISPLRQAVATAVAQAIWPPWIPVDCDGKPTGERISTAEAMKSEAICSNGVICDDVRVCASGGDLEPEHTQSDSRIQPSVPTLTGIDVLEADHYSQLTSLLPQHEGHLRLGLLTNQTGIDHIGKRTVDVLHTDLPKVVPGAQLVRIFSPEHGIAGRQDSTDMKGEVDTATGMPVVGLYGAGAAARHPTHDQLKDLDAVVVDIQDVGVRFYTYEAAMAYFLEAAGSEMRDFHHRLDVIVLDRPTPIGGLAVQGPVSDPGREGYTNYMPMPVRHGMTLGELARLDNGEKSLGAPLTVVAMQGWQRSMFFDQTGLPWVVPSPNLHDLTAEILYPGLALMEATNMSVGRGSATPFELFGAGVPAKDPKTNAQPVAWFHAKDVANALNALALPGVRFEPATTAIAEDSFHYPFHGQTIEAVRAIVTDRVALDSPAMGVAILSVLHRLYPEQFTLAKARYLVTNQATMDALTRGDDPKAIVQSWAPALEQYKAMRARYLLY